MIKNMISKKSDETDERKKSRTVCSALFNGASNGKGVVMVLFCKLISAPFCKLFGAISGVAA